MPARNGRNCSPGRLIIGRTMAHLHAQGIRQFDFSIGNYAYKRRFDVAPVALVDKTARAELAGVAKRGARKRHPVAAPPSRAGQSYAPRIRQNATFRRSLRIRQQNRELGSTAAITPRAA